MGVMMTNVLLVEIKSRSTNFYRWIFTRELFRWYCLDETSLGSLCSAVVKGFQSKLKRLASVRGLRPPKRTARYYLRVQYIPREEKLDRTAATVGRKVRLLVSFFFLWQRMSSARGCVSFWYVL